MKKVDSNASDDSLMTIGTNISKNLNQSHCSSASCSSSNAMKIEGHSKMFKESTPFCSILYEHRKRRNVSESINKFVSKFSSSFGTSVHEQSDFKHINNYVLNIRNKSMLSTKNQIPLSDTNIKRNPQKTLLQFWGKSQVDGSSPTLPHQQNYISKGATLNCISFNDTRTVESQQNSEEVCSNPMEQVNERNVVHNLQTRFENHISSATNMNNASEKLPDNKPQAADKITTSQSQCYQEDIKRTNNNNNSKSVSVFNEVRKNLKSDFKSCHDAVETNIDTEARNKTNLKCSSVKTKESNFSEIIPYELEVAEAILGLPIGDKMHGDESCANTCEQDENDKHELVICSQPPCSMSVLKKHVSELPEDVTVDSNSISSRISFVLEKCSEKLAPKISRNCSKDSMNVSFELISPYNSSEFKENVVYNRSCMSSSDSCGSSSTQSDDGSEYYNDDPCSVPKSPHSEDSNLSHVNSENETSGSSFYQSVALEVRCAGCSLCLKNMSIYMHLVRSKKCQKFYNFERLKKTHFEFLKLQKNERMRKYRNTIKNVDRKESKVECKGCSNEYIDLVKHLTANKKCRSKYDFADMKAKNAEKKFAKKKTATAKYVQKKILEKAARNDVTQLEQCESCSMKMLRLGSHLLHKRECNEYYGGPDAVAQLIRERRTLLRRERQRKRYAESPTYREKRLSRQKLYESERSKTHKRVFTEEQRERRRRRQRERYQQRYNQTK